MQEEYHARGQELYMCFCGPRESFCQSTSESVGMGVEEGGIPYVLVRSVMNLYEGANMIVRVDSVLSEEFEVNVWIHQGSVLSPFLFAILVDVVAELARDIALSELLCANGLVLMSETIEGLRNKLMKLRRLF